MPSEERVKSLRKKKVPICESRRHLLCKRLRAENNCSRKLKTSGPRHKEELKKRGLSKVFLRADEDLQGADDCSAR
jgi:hypothetical protein